VRVVISVGGRFHAIPLAVELDRLGYLEKIITTKAWYVKKLLPSRRFTAIGAPEYIGMLVRMVPAWRRAGYYSYVKDNLFDGLARRYIPPCDIFHAWGNYALVSMQVARRHGARVVIERGSTHPHYQDAILREEFERYGVHVERAHPQIIAKGLEEIERADKVVIPSEFVRRSFIEAGVPAGKLATIPYGIDLAAFRAEPKRDETFRVLFVGNIGIQKGVHYLLEAWKRLGMRDAELVLAGRVEEEMRGVLARYDGLFTLRGHVPHEELYREYSNASVFVLPSLQEGSALVTYEAMACGVPLLVSENTGSVVRDGLDGWVIPIRDVESIMTKLAWFRDHPSEASEMGASAAAHVQQYTWARYTQQVVGVYEELLGGAARGVA
jgi:glycosyltransferase involved in cell wall biosynthesis